MLRPAHVIDEPNKFWCDFRAVLRNLAASTTHRILVRSPDKRKGTPTQSFLQEFLPCLRVLTVLPATEVSKLPGSDFILCQIVGFLAVAWNSNRKSAFRFTANSSAACKMFISPSVKEPLPDWVGVWTTPHSPCVYSASRSLISGERTERRGSSGAPNMVETEHMRPLSRDVAVSNQDMPRRATLRHVFASS